MFNVNVFYFQNTFSCVFILLILLVVTDVGVKTEKWPNAGGGGIRNSIRCTDMVH